MARRVAVDPGHADPTAARTVVAAALQADTDLHVLLLSADATAGDDRLHVRAGRPLPDDLPPEVAVRGRPDLALRVALEALRDREVDAVVSASPHAALSTAVGFVLRRRRGVRDPLVATVVATERGPVTICDTSGRSGTTAASLLAAAADLPTGRTGWLATGVTPNAAAGAAADALAEGLGTSVVPLDPAAVLAGRADVVFCDGAAGQLFVDTVEALDPMRVGLRRVVGTEPGDVLDVPPDPGHWAEALAAAGGRT